MNNPFYSSSWSCFINPNRTRVSLSALAPDCLCQAGPTPWSVIPILNRTILAILVLCKVMFTGSPHPLAPAPAQLKTTLHNHTLLSLSAT